MYNSQAPHNQYGNALPFPIDACDQNTMLAGLPQTNNVFPPLNQSPNLGNDLMVAIVSEFRAIAQSRVGKSPIHNFVYNMFSQNYFNNPVYTDWLQRTVDFTDFLMVAQGNPPGIAIRKAVEKIYFSSLAVTLGQYRDLGRYLDAGIVDELVRQGNEYNDILRDVGAFIQNGRRPVQFNTGVPAPMQSFGVNTGYRPQQLPPITQMTTGVYQAALHHAAPVLHGNVTTPTSNTGGGRYVAEAAIEQATSWKNNVTSEKVGKPQPFSITPPFQAQKLAVVEEPLVPSSIDDVVMDPYYHIPAGVTIDEHRPYDYFYNPGGVEIKPAHLSNWKRTRTAGNPYALGYDASIFVLFHVKWPDGLVQEKLVKWETSMDYLAHEINDAIRATRVRPTGKVVLNRHKVIDMTAQPAVSVEKAKETLDHAIDVSGEMAPVLLESYYAGNSDMENEAQAYEDAKAALGLAANSDVMMPHEYVSVSVFPMDISKECEEKLLELHKCTAMASVADGLRLLYTSGVLTTRYYRFIDERLTDGINAMLRDNLSMPSLNIDSFVDDIDDLIKILRNKEGMELIQTINNKTRNFLNRYLRLTSADEGLDSECLAITEERINLQTTWSYESLASLSLSKKQAVLINQSTHPKLHGVVVSLVDRRREEDSLKGRAIRLITVDGVYLEVIDGYLINGAVLLKRM